MITACSVKDRKAGTTSGVDIGYEKFILKNGLTVILHEDRSDPVVAINMTAHVGSSRELPGKTGFAHLFEHLLFNESENLGRGGLETGQGSCLSSIGIRYTRSFSGKQ